MLNIKIPPNTNSEVYLPSDMIAVFEITPTGNKKISQPDFLNNVPAKLITIGSGIYRFICSENIDWLSALNLTSLSMLIQL